MGKRSSFPRRARDAYDTPLAAVLPLLPHLPPRMAFIDPCAGRGDLIEHLTSVGHQLIGAYDLPDKDARSATYPRVPDCRFVTNPPWRCDFLHSILVNLSNQGPAWLLIYSDWLHTRQAAPFMSRLRLIVSVGRVKWIPDSRYTGMENAVWCLFDRPDADARTCFVGRSLGHRGRTRWDDEAARLVQAKSASREFARAE
jgi:hypothetical protein